MMTKIWTRLVFTAPALALLSSSLLEAATAFSDLNIDAAVEKVLGKNELFDFETLQLTDDVLANLKDAGFGDEALSLFSPKSKPVKRQVVAKPPCKIYPGDATWPSGAIWRLFNVLLGGALIRTVPEASLCYPEWQY